MLMDFDANRQQMVAEQIARRGLRDPRLLDAFQTIPRHRFVSTDQQADAYGDFPLPIGCGQTISQPYIVALMTDLLHLEGDETILEVGTGSGYQAAILSRMASRVHTIERHPQLAENALKLLHELGLDNVTVHVGDGSLGLPEEAPFEGILVTAAAPRPPQPLLEQLADGGRLVLPVGARYYQELQVWTRQVNNYDHETVLAVAFVPLYGEHGWREEDWTKI
jgi:protein-L-isoaspartate(D-aspartate) O-methyltransferase